MTELSHPKIKWHCRRGMLELDLLLIPYFDNCFAQLSPELQHSFIQLLDCADPDIYNWFLNAETPPIEFMSIIEQLRDYHK